MDEIRKVA